MGDGRGAERPGKEFGKYRILRKLGQGGMGVVYEAEDTLLGRRVALKVLPESLAADAKAMSRFRREARAAHRLDHPHVVAMFDINQQKGIYFIAMELMTGGTAEDRTRGDRSLDWSEATRLTAQACAGLGAAHRAGILHRDIKPSNLLLTADGCCKISDFGLAKAVDKTQTQTLTATGTVLGTPNFMSPEQCRSEEMDARSDLYSLGATYFSLLTGRSP